MDYIKMVWYNKKNVWKKWIINLVDNDWLLRLNEKHLEQGLDQKYLQEIATKKIQIKEKIGIS